MSKQSPDNKPIELSSLDFGPAWARKNDSPKKEYRSYDGEKKRRPAKGARNSQGGQGRPAGKQGGQRGDFKGKGRPAGKDFKGKGRRPQQFTPAEELIEASIMPIEEGVDNLAKEITAAGRTYSVFELARVVLGARERFSIIFKKISKDGKEGPEMLQCKEDGALFLTQEECLSHAASAEWMNTLYKSEEIEVEAPAGNFQTIAKCGFSGELLGPTNFHGYQDRVLELYNSKFSNMSLEQYKRRIETESGDDIVNLWKEGMKKRTIYKLASDESVVLDSKSAMLQHFTTEGFAKVFHKTHKAQVPSDIEAKKLSPSLLTNLKEVIQDQRRYPGALSSFLCRQLSGRQLAVFKWQGKLHCGPSRPHVVPEDLKMADRPAAIYKWVCDNVGAGIDELWKAMWPEEIEDEKKHEWYHDLHWLINAGYVIFMNSGHLFPSSASKKPTTQVAKTAPTKQAKPAKKQAAPSESAKSAEKEVKQDPAKSEAPKSDTAETPKEVKDAPKAESTEEKKPEEGAE